jgi:S-adenosylmethionine:tRNA ribosyltransferase-isomerase
MRVSEFDFKLPPERIAQRPLAERDASRLLLLERKNGAWQDELFRNFPNLLRGDELIVFNNVRVLPARLFGARAGVHSQPPPVRGGQEHLSGRVELFLTRQIETDIWEALVRPGRKMKVGERIWLGGGSLEAEILTHGEHGLRTVRFRAGPGQTIGEAIERLGHMPLPPYIDRVDDVTDRERYQTIFARQPGAVAAPTAGLHFTPEVLQRTRERGCELCEVTLNVGLGTFQPVHTENLEEHKIHAESYQISAETAAKIKKAKRAGRPILAVGTTVTRALEDGAVRAAESGAGEVVKSGAAEANIFLLPGHSFRVVDQLLTNFHLPKSTLLALVSAFAGREQVLKAYQHAIEARYRFYSYGDCMLIR